MSARTTIIREFPLRRLVETLTRRFRKKKRGAEPPAQFWRQPESGPLKQALIEERWGKKAVPTVMVFDLTPLRSLGHDDEIEVARRFFGEAKFPSGSITYRESQSSEHPMTYLTVKYAKHFHADVTVRGYRLPLFRVSHRAPGRTGTLIEFKDLAPGALDALKPTG